MNMSKTIDPNAKMPYFQVPDRIFDSNRELPEAFDRTELIIYQSLLSWNSV
jgi:hypothetical protein